MYILRTQVMHLLVCVGVFMLFVSAQSNSDQLICDLTWQIDGRQCYKAFDSRLTFTYAKRKCENEGAVLVKMETDEDKLRLTSLLNTVNQRSGWLGLHRDSSGTLRWLLDNSTYSGKAKTLRSNQCFISLGLTNLVRAEKCAGRMPKAAAMCQKDPQCDVKTTSCEMTSIYAKTTTTVQPPTTVAQPTTTVAQPPTTVAQPTTSVAQPTTSVAQPPSTVAQPSTTVAQPSTTIAQPATTVAQPATTVAQPSTTVAQPSTTIAQPTTSVAQPSTSVAQPPSTAEHAHSTATTPRSKWHDNENEPESNMTVNPLNMATHPHHRRPTEDHKLTIETQSITETAPENEDGDKTLLPATVGLMSFAGIAAIAGTVGGLLKKFKYGKIVPGSGKVEESRETSELDNVA